MTNLDEPAGTVNLYGSIDSAPPRLARVLSVWVAPRMLCTFTILSTVLLELFRYLHVDLRLLVHPDIVFFSYAGTHSLPLRLFEMCFFMSFACHMDGTLGIRTRFLAANFLFFLSACALLDLLNAIARQVFGFAFDIHEAQIASALLGLLIFALNLLNMGDMPARESLGRVRRQSLVPWLTLVAVLFVAGTVVLWCVDQQMLIVVWMRENALLGGLGPGVFLFIPLVSLLIYTLGKIRLGLAPTDDFPMGISVIIPAYNEAHVIARTIRSIDAAAGKHSGALEIIVIDNGSIDHTADSVRQELATLEHCRGMLVHEGQAGKAYALNRGIQESRNPFILRIDADTQISPDSIRLAMRHFRDEKMGAVGGLCTPPGIGPFDRARLIEVLLKAGFHQVGYASFDAIVGIPGMFTLYRTEALVAAGNFEEGMNGEDTDASWRIGELGYRTVVDPAVFYVSEVPTTYAALREQRIRWFRSIYHVAARNRDFMDDDSFSLRGKVIIPFMLMNSIRRAVTVPLLKFGVLCLLTDFNPQNPVSLPAIFATLIGAPAVIALLATLFVGRFGSCVGLGDYVIFRVMRCYFTMECILTIGFSNDHRSKRDPERSLQNFFVNSTPNTPPP